MNADDATCIAISIEKREEETSGADTRREILDIRATNRRRNARE